DNISAVSPVGRSILFATDRPLRTGRLSSSSPSHDRDPKAAPAVTPPPWRSLPRSHAGSSRPHTTAPPCARGPPGAATNSERAMLNWPLVLLIHDDSEGCPSLRDIVENQGLAPLCSAAGDGPELFRRCNPDVAVVDLALPDGP